MNKKDTICPVCGKPLYKILYGEPSMTEEEYFKTYGEHATMAFLKWFIDEQVEEEATFNTLIAKISRIKNDSNGMFMLDTELANRTFTPPVEGK